MASVTNVWSTINAASPLSITTSPTAGRTLLGVFVTDTSATETFSGGTLPAGFSGESAITTTIDSMCLIYVIKDSASGSEGALSFALASGATMVGCVIEIDGLDTTKLDVSPPAWATNNTANASPWTATANSITPVSNGALILAVMGSDETTGSHDAVHTFSGGGLTWTTVADLADNSNGFRQLAVGVATQSTAAAITVSGTGTIAGGSAGWAIRPLVFRPTGGGGGGSSFTPRLSLLGVG